MAAGIPPGSALTGWAVAVAVGIAGVDGRDPRTVAELPVGVVTGGRQGHRAPGHVAVIRRPLGDVRVQRVRVWSPVVEELTSLELRLVEPAVAVCDELVSAERLDCAVAFCDQVLHAGGVTLADLEAEAGRRRGRPGVARLREVLTLADADAASPWESILRVFCVRVLEWRGLQVNVPVRDVRGRPVGIVDLLDAEAGVVIEYDGAYHRDRHQHRDDNVREEALEALGLIVVRVDSLDILRRSASLAGRLRAARARGLRRDRSYDAWGIARAA